MVIPREVPPEAAGPRRDYTPTPQVTRAYLLGVLHDATKRKTTYRISTSSWQFADVLASGIKKLGLSAWIYKEGKKRHLWIVEFSQSLLQDSRITTQQDKIDYIRGYFDSEGGIAKNPKVRYYLYFAQKNKSDLGEVKRYLQELGVACGKLHNPSQRVDPDYWRFFILAQSRNDFGKIIGSYHPIKSTYLRVKI